MLTDNLIRIVNAGGGISVDASSMMTDNLVKIVTASRNKNTVVILRNCDKLMTDNLVRIAGAGNNNVIFEF